jgi:galactokinase
VIVASAPGRCGVLGNPTDMYGGSVISCSTRERAFCELYEDADALIVEADNGERQELTSPPTWSRAATGSTSPRRC